MRTLKGQTAPEAEFTSGLPYEVCGIGRHEEGEVVYTMDLGASNQIAQAQIQRVPLRKLPGGSVELDGPGR